MLKHLSRFFAQKEIIVTPDVTPDFHIYEKTSFSQCGEDLIIDYIFQLRGLSHPTYLDIGAHHPWFINNTAIFYLRGCRGVNIEANPALCKRFFEERPLDVNLNIGITDQAGTMDFTIFEDLTLSTMSVDESNHLIRCGHKPIETIKVSTDTINNIIEVYFNGTQPDLLTLDTEGYDLQILQAINKKHSPKIICVESAEYSTTGSGAKRKDLINYVVCCGYYLYADTNLNTIFVHNEFWSTDGK